MADEKTIDDAIRNDRARDISEGRGRKWGVRDDPLEGETESHWTCYLSEEDWIELKVKLKKGKGEKN